MKNIIAIIVVLCLIGAVIYLNDKYHVVTASEIEEVATSIIERVKGWVTE